MVDFSTLDLLSHAMSGNVAPLAKHIEAGGHICPATRQFLASYLRGEVKHPRGNRRTYAKIVQDAQIAGQIMFLRRVLGRSRGERLLLASEEKAKNAFIDLNPEMNSDTLKTILRRAKGRAKRVSKSR